MSATSSEKKPRVSVLWDSANANCEQLAADFKRQFEANGWWCDTAEMSLAGDLSTEPLVLAIVGDGLPEIRGHFLFSKLSRLDDTHFSVLSLGSDGWGEMLDSRLEELGGTRVHQLGLSKDGDDSGKAWFGSLIPKLYEKSFDTFAREVVLPQTTEPAAPAQVPDIAYGKKNPFPAKLLVNRDLNKKGSFKDTRHLEYCLKGSGLSYEVGDVLAAYPHNDPALIDEMLVLLPFDTGSSIELKDGATIPFRQALIENFDVRTVNKTVMKKWGAKCNHPHLLAALEDPEELASLIDGIEVIDLLIHYPAQFEDAQEFVGVLRKLNPRLYSIASSLKAHPEEVHLTIAKVEYETRGRHRKGVASTYLCDRMDTGDTVRIFLQTSKHFRLPENPSTDVIMIGPGTGIAPFRAFLEERAAVNAPGRNWLFFGNPYEKTDFFYENEFKSWSKSGVLTRLDVAWSRDQAEKVYVQDKMREVKAELWQWLEAGAHFYVCGDASRMAGDVEVVLRETIRDEGRRSEEAVDLYLKQMKEDHRYQRDVY